MYYHWTPGTPEMSGELRFRLCDDVRSFSEGDDLMIPELWRPWRVPLYSMVKNKLLYDSFVPLLLQEGLVEQSLVDDISNLPKFQIGPTPVLYHCRQPFPVVLNSTGINLILLTNKLMEHVTLKDTFVGRTPTAKLRYYQFSGTYLAQFERAPKVSHPSLHLRFVKPLTDIKRLTSKLVMAEPAPGALFAKIKEDGSPPEPWKYRIDTNSGNGKALTKFQGQTRNFKIPDLPL
ncbi:hypothetical protein CPC08DRAFT_710417 [Agrocybe pediades]|nr:hypothetical protein CPC08DRAFT_710417 [Agrocybe pediades]